MLSLHRRALSAVLLVLPTVPVMSVTPAAARGPLVSCVGSPPFPASALSGPVLSRDEPLAADRFAVTALVPPTTAAPGSRGPLMPPLDVRFAVERDHVRWYLWSNRDGRGDLVFLAVDAATAEPRFHGSGTCNLRTTIDGVRAAPWYLAPGQRLTAATRVLHLFVQEEQCGGGGDLTGRVRLAIRVSRTTFELTVAVTPRTFPPDVAPSCQAFPPSSVTVRLRDRLGGRQLLDGAWYPARAAVRAAVSRGS